MVILIVEEDRRYAKHLEEMLDTCVKDLQESFTGGADVRIKCRGREALYDVEDVRIHPYIIFIDVHAGKLDGIEIAGKMKRSIPTAQIIFLTEAGKYTPDVYEVEHVYLIDKQTASREHLEKALRKAADRIDAGNTYFECIVNRRRHYVPYSSILYFENIKRKITIHTDKPGEEISFYETMARLEDKLPDHFVRCHNSFIVNLDRISSYGMTSVMIGDKEIMVSRKYKEKMRRMVGE